MSNSVIDSPPPIPPRKSVDKGPVSIDNIYTRPILYNSNYVENELIEEREIVRNSFNKDCCNALLLGTIALGLIGSLLVYLINNS